MEAPAVTGIFRSRLNLLPMSLKERLGEIPLQKGMRPTSRKEMALDALDKAKIPFVELGTGTNRFIFKHDGYVVKVALDHEGIADNIQEYAICEPLWRYGPDIAYSHEISRGGHLAVANYCPAFTSPSEMWIHSSAITAILTKWTKHGFLLGDVGMTDYNYANWGLAPGGNPVCIDYAYVFPADLDLFKCICGSKRLDPVSNFSKYKCAICGHVYEDREIRARISKETRIKLFENAGGIVMTEPTETHPVDPKYIKYDDSPNAADPYEVAYNVGLMKQHKDSPYWKGKR